jgi:WD40 repeat protein
LAGIIEEKGTWEVRRWDITSGREGKRLATTKDGQIPDLAFSPDGKLQAIGMGEKNWNKPFVIQLWDAAGAKEVRTLRGLKGWASFAFSPDGKSLVAAESLDRTVYVWDTNTGKELRRLRGDPWTPINGFLMCADGKTLVTKYQGELRLWSEHGLRLWSLANGKELQSSDEAVCPISCVSFSPDGRLVAAGSHDSVIRLWDTVTKKEARRFRHEFGELTSVLFSPDGRRLASAGFFHDVWIWDAASGKTLRRLKGAKERGSLIRSLTWSGDGRIWRYARAFLASSMTSGICRRAHSTTAGWRFSRMHWRKRGVRTGSYSTISVGLDLMSAAAGRLTCASENREVLPCANRSGCDSRNRGRC